MTNFLNLPKLKPIQYGSTYPLFTRISLETCRTCTRSCWFCPSSERGKTPYQMPDVLYWKILSELEDMRFAGVVQWFYLNEPLLDRDHLVRIAALRAQVRRCTIHLTTNWDIMHKRGMDEQIGKIEALFAAGVNSLNLNDYDARGYAQTAQRAARELGVPLVNHCWKRLSIGKRVLSCGPLPEAGKVHTWTGYLSGEELRQHGATSQGARADSRCPRPMRHIVVMSDGRVPLCCAVNSERADLETFGNVNKCTLLEAWNSKGMFQYRERLQRGERSGQCAGCDATVAYSHVVRRVKL